MSKSKKFLFNFSGSIGDLGTLFPLLIGVSAVNGVNLPYSLAVVGSTYIITGLVLRVPVPVQPLKVACSLAIALKCTPSIIQAGTFEMAFILLIVSLTGLANKLERFFDQSIIRGLQLGIGLILIERGFLMATESVSVSPAMGSKFNGSLPALSDWWIAFTLIVVPQIPVTLSNAVVGSSFTAHRYYRWMAKKVSVQSLSLSMGFANVVAGSIGTLPICHGSSGWTAHRRLGARSFFSTIFTGFFLILLSVLTGTRHPQLITMIPSWLLAGLLIYVGCCHALLIRDSHRSLEMFFNGLAIGVISFAVKNPAIGLGTGLLLQNIQRLEWNRIAFTTPLGYSRKKRSIVV